MPNDYFQFKQFLVRQSDTAMKVTTDSCLFGAWCANEIKHHRKIRDDAQTDKLLDIGAGTGLLSLMVAQKNNVQITAVEIEKKATDQCRDNIMQSPFSNRISVHETDILEFPGSGFDYIICNPPFYENELSSPEENRNIAHHSHLLKWSELFPVIHRKLNSEGAAFILLPSSRINLANELIESETFFINKEILVLRSEGRSPFRRMIKISEKNTAPVIEELIIRDRDGNYSAEFTAYLKDYYLKL